MIVRVILVNCLGYLIIGEYNKLKRSDSYKLKKSLNDVFFWCYRKKVYKRYVFFEELSVFFGVIMFFVSVLWWSFKRCFLSLNRISV